MQKSIYGNTELVYEDGGITVRSNTKQRVKSLLMFGFWFYCGVMTLIGGIVQHKTGWIGFGAVLTLFNGLMLAFQFLPQNGACTFDVASGTVRRGKNTTPITDVVAIDVMKQSNVYTLWIIFRGSPKQALNGLAPIKLAEARRLAGEISQFTGIQVRGFDTPALPTTIP